MRVRLLGGFRVSVGSRVIEEDDWRLRKAKSLIKLLALAPNHRAHREQIMDALWPELEREDQTNNLRQARYAVRRALEPVSATSSRYLRLKNEEISLCPDGALWVDVEAFEEAATAARSGREPAAYRTAIELYSGELLPEDRYESWAEERRKGLRETYLALLFELAGLYKERGEYGRGIEALRRVLSEEPDREEAHVGLMRLYAFSGRTKEALRQYERLEEILHREHGEEPGAESRHLRDEILSGRFPPSRPVPEYRLPAKYSLPEGATATSQHNLPATRGSFVGRERDVVEVKRLLVMTGLLSLIGAGGSGKTRLALEIAKDLVGLYPDGVWLVELAPLSEGNLVPQAVAAALGEREQPGRPLTDTLVDAVREKKLLLVLDNCEHLVDAAAQLVDTLLSSCPRLQVLATSREPLGVVSEATWRVPPLSVPGADRLPAAEDLERYEAVRLFVERARLKLPGFEITPANTRAVAEVCRKLDGIPLAIELATARMTALTVEQIAERLEDSLKLLTGGARTADPRHRTMRATLEWSYKLLDEPEQELFERLSVFAGGWTLEAAEAVGARDDVEESDVLDLISRLVDQSLVIAEAWAEGTLRYRMLEPVRQYARDKLEESGEAAQVLGRHAEHYLALAERAERELSGPDQALWLDRLETEHDNLRAALAWSLEGEEPELGLRLVGALWLFWYTRGYLREGREWLEKAASTDRVRTLRLKARALCGAGYIVARQGDLGAAKGFLEEALALFRQMEDKEGVASALIMLGITNVLEQQNLETIPVLHEEVMSLKPDIQDPRTRAYLLQFSGIIAVSQGDWERADALHEESLELFREVRDVAGINASLTNLGLSALAQTEYPRALALLQENLRVLPSSDKAALTYNLLGLACAVSAQGEPVRATRLWGAAEAIREAFDLQINPLARERINYDEHLSTARSRLGEAAYARAWAEGKAMTQEEAVRSALGNVEPGPPEVSPPVVSGSDAGLVRMRAEALNRAGYLAIFQGQYETGKGLLEEALSLFRELGDKEGVASSLAYLGLAAVFAQQDLETVPVLLEEAMILRPEIEDWRTIALMLIVSGLLAGSLNNWERAKADHEEALRLFREIRDSRGMSMCTTNLGLIALVQADYERATTLLKENLRISSGPDYKAGIHYSLFGLAGVAARQGRPARAARLWGAAEAVRETFGICLTLMARRHLAYDENLAAIRAQLGEAAYARAWAEGKAMTQEEAVDYALGNIEPFPSVTPESERISAGKGAHKLTRREKEIAALVMRGFTTNRQLSAELSISERTVETHVRNILKKLGLNSRAQLAARMAEGRLLDEYYRG